MMGILSAVKMADVMVLLLVVMMAVELVQQTDF